MMTMTTLTPYIVLFFAAIAVIVVAKMLAWPFKKIIKLIFNIIGGIILLLLVNMFGSNIGIGVQIDIISALVAGILGVPGVILLILLNFFR